MCFLLFSPQLFQYCFVTRARIRQNPSKGRAILNKSVDSSIKTEWSHGEQKQTNTIKKAKKRSKHTKQNK